MQNETIMVRGTESDLAAFHADLQAYLAEHNIMPSQLTPLGPVPARRRLTDRAPLGHEAWLELAIEIGKAVASGVLSGAMKDLVVPWIKEHAKKKGLQAETKSS